MEESPVSNKIKNPLLSKTIWTNVIGVLAIYLTTEYNFEVSEEQQAQLVGWVIAILNIILRFVSDTKVRF